MDTDSFIAYIKADDLYKDIAEDVETRYGTSNFELNRPLSKEKNKKVIGLLKDELGGKVMTKFVGLRAKTYSYLTDDGSENKKANSTEKRFIKRKLKFENCKNCFEAIQLDNKINCLEKNKINIDSLKRNHKQFIINNKSILKTQQRFKSERHNVFTNEINKIALSSDDDKRMQSIDLIETYACGMNKDLVCKKEEVK